MTCQGGKSISCGGYDAFDLFKFSTQTPESPETQSPETQTPVTQAPGTQTPEEDFETSPTPVPETTRPTRPTERPTGEPTERRTPGEEFELSRTPTPERKTPETPETKTVKTPSKSGRFSDLLKLHNAARCIHGTNPLGYSDEVARVAQAYPEVLASQICGQLEHSTERNGYGENLYMCGSSRSDCYQATEAMKGLYDSEVEPFNRVTDYGGHATHFLWKWTTEAGCGLSNCNSGGFDYQVLVCDYTPPGNCGGQYEEQVGLPVKSPQSCGYN